MSWIFLLLMKNTQWFLKHIQIKPKKQHTNSLFQLKFCSVCNLKRWFKSELCIIINKWQDKHSPRSGNIYSYFNSCIRFVLFYLYPRRRRLLKHQLWYNHSKILEEMTEEIYITASVTHEGMQKVPGIETGFASFPPLKSILSLIF